MFVTGTALLKSSSNQAFSEPFADRTGRTDSKTETAVKLTSNPKEFAFQDYVVKQLQLVDAKVADTSTLPYLDGRKPDVSMFHSSISASLYTLLVGEVKPKGESSFSPSAKGELLTFLKRVLYCQPQRQRVVGFLTDGFGVVFMGLMRSGKLRYTPRLPLGPKASVGRLALISLIKAKPSAIGFVELKGVPKDWTPMRLLGSGATASVYAARPAVGGDESCVIKLCSTIASAEREEQVLLQLSALPNVPRVLQRHQTSLVLEPLAEPFDRSYAMPRARHFLELLKVLQAAHGLGLVHRDLRPENWMQISAPKSQANGQSLLIDWGYAKKSSLVSAYLGTVSFASEQVLVGLTRREDVKVGSADDLESFVRLVYYYATGLRPCYEDGATPIEKAHASLFFWKSVKKQSTFWKRWADLAAARNFSGLQQLAEVAGFDPDTDQLTDGPGFE
jgi:hypothetical protein